MFDVSKIPAAFDRWLDECTNHPEKFQTIEATVAERQAERNDGKKPAYGINCTAILLEYIRLNDVEENGASG